MILLRKQESKVRKNKGPKPNFSWQGSKKQREKHIDLTVNWDSDIFKMLCVIQVWTHPNQKEQGDMATAEEDYEGDKSLSCEEAKIHQPTLEIKERGRQKVHQLSAYPTLTPAPSKVLLLHWIAVLWC